MEKQNTEMELEKPSFWGKLLLLVLLVLAIILVFIGFGDIQKDLQNHLKLKKDALEQIYNNIEKARKMRVRLLSIKRISRIIIRLIFVLFLISGNWCYIYCCNLERDSIPQILGAITDLNAIFLLLLSALVFLFYGSFLNLKDLLDRVQNRIMKRFFHKKEEFIEALLKTNLEDREAIRKEIQETEKAILENEALLVSPELPLNDIK